MIYIIIFLYAMIEIYPLQFELVVVDKKFMHAPRAFEHYKH